MNRWKSESIGSIVWNVDGDGRLPHDDHVEMSGLKTSLHVCYGVTKDKRINLSQESVYPTLRTIPNNTHASLIAEYKDELFPALYLNGAKLEKERIQSIYFDGVLSTKGYCNEQVQITRSLFPSREELCSMEEIRVKNISSKIISISCNGEKTIRYARGCYGVYILEHKVESVLVENLQPEEEISIGVYFTGRIANEEPVERNIEKELSERRSYIESIKKSLCLTTPDEVINQAFTFAKIRAAESVFLTRGGFMHCPGGLSYYAAIWTNDQVEYAGPFFPFLGDKNAVTASKNAYELYIPFMGGDYSAIPSSIVAEGTDIWEGAGDRGDAAMYAYGASNFVLANGDEEYARKLWDSIVWCLNYCEKKKNQYGVIASDSDELENRFESGNANLSTSMLTYGAYRAAACLAKELDKPEYQKQYEMDAKELRIAIEKYFGANVQGFETYQYYEGNDKLRSWICLPLVFGVDDRKEETIRALFSDCLWTKDGLATESGCETFWDRSTLYALRGIFYAGETKQAYQHLKEYSKRRAFGEHVPYPVEAYPEGNQRHLSAESALYCRIITEGIFGIVPTGFHSFTLQINMPEEWNEMKLSNIHAFGAEFDIKVIRSQNKQYIVTIIQGEKEKNFIMQDEVLDITIE